MWNSSLCLRVASLWPPSFSLSLSLFLFVNLCTVDNGTGKFPLITDYVIFCTCYILIILDCRRKLKRNIARKESSQKIRATVQSTFKFWNFLPIFEKRRKKKVFLWKTKCVIFNFVDEWNSVQNNNNGAFRKPAMKNKTITAILDITVVKLPKEEKSGH